jgi:Metallo-beta-lactamase superfamily
MHTPYQGANRMRRTATRRRSSTKLIFLMVTIGVLGAGSVNSVSAEDACNSPGCSGTPYLNMPAIAPIGTRIGKYLDIPESAKGPALDPAKGYRIQALGRGLYMVTENVYQSMFMVYEKGVVIIDAPPSLAAYLPKAIAEITDKPITHLIYSHSHVDHIGGAHSLGGRPTIVRRRPRHSLIVIPCMSGLKLSNCPTMAMVTSLETSLSMPRNKRH